MEKKKKLLFEAPKRMTAEERRQWATEVFQKMKEEYLEQKETDAAQAAEPEEDFAADPRWSHYAEHRTRYQLRKLLRYGHPIPAGKGFTDAYVEEHFPGWTWSTLMAVWKAAGIVESGMPPRCDERVKTIHFNSPTSFAVEWIDETITTSEGD